MTIMTHELVESPRRPKKRRPKKRDEWGGSLHRIPIRTRPVVDKRVRARIATQRALTAIARAGETVPLPSRNVFQRMATTKPGKLALWLLGGIPEHTLGGANTGFAAEALGQSSWTHSFIVLEGLLSREEPLAREGVVYGLEALLPSLWRNEVTKILQRIASDDRSPGVREAACEALDV